MKSMLELLGLWKQLGNVPIDEDENTEADFLHFKKGTPKEEIWHWFESQNEEFIIGKLMEIGLI